MLVFCFYCSGMANVRNDRRDCRKCVVDEYGHWPVMGFECGG